MNNRIAFGISWGKIILLGEHSVVYGMPAIAIPIKSFISKTIMEYKKGEAEIITDYYTGSLDKTSNEILGLVTAIKETITQLNQDLQNFTITIKSEIPKERGMGSSAAVAVSSIKAIYNFFNEQLTKEKLLELTNIAEKINHGNPSGIDASTTISDEPIYYIKEQGIKSFKMNLSAYLVIADSGVMGKTKEAVSDVRKLFSQDKQKISRVLKELGRITDEAKTFLETNEVYKLGKNMSMAHNLLRKLTVSNDVLDKLVNCALDEGALGAKLTGGGRGGCIIALTKTLDQARKVSAKLKENGAGNTWIYNMEDNYEGIS